MLEVFSGRRIWKASAAIIVHIFLTAQASIFPFIVTGKIIILNASTTLMWNDTFTNFVTYRYIFPSARSFSISKYLVQIHVKFFINQIKLLNLFFFFNSYYIVI